MANSSDIQVSGARLRRGIARLTSWLWFKSWQLFCDTLNLTPSGNGMGRMGQLAGTVYRSMSAGYGVCCLYVPESKSPSFGFV